MGPWGSGLGKGIGPLNLWPNFLWENGMTLYYRTKTENNRILIPPYGPFGGPYGAPRGTGGTQGAHT